MVQTGTFIDGIINGQGAACREFILHERTFRHALEVGNDRTIQQDLLSDPVYYDAVIISKRLKVAGIDRMTPEQVLDLCAEDGDCLIDAILQLDQRRAEFRSQQQAAAQAAAGPAEAGSSLD